MTAALGMACDAVGLEGAQAGIAALSLCGGTDKHPHVAAAVQGTQEHGVSGASQAHESPTMQATVTVPSGPEQGGRGM